MDGFEVQDNMLCSRSCIKVTVLNSVVDVANYIL